jgi:N-acetylglucosaminyldiphosphoundecaprenol N-acetyl-beta-D-mannosaminyltransferase
MNQEEKNQTNSGRKFATILNIRVDSTSKEGLLRKIDQKMHLASKFYIVTPNPEIILQAQTDPLLASILNQADISVPDGIGLSQAATYLSLKIPKAPILRETASLLGGLWVGLLTFVNRKVLFKNLNIIKGRLLFLWLLAWANRNQKKVFLFGSTNEVMKKCLSKLRSEFPYVKGCGVAGPIFDKNGEPVSERDGAILQGILYKINTFSPDFLFVALGAPKQEKWIAKNLDKVNAKCFMAVGGALDYYSGKKKLPPAFLDRVGLEWLWRLIFEPGRIRRIFNAWPVFPLKIWRYKMTQN